MLIIGSKAMRNGSGIDVMTKLKGNATKCGSRVPMFLKDTTKAGVVSREEHVNKTKVSQLGQVTVTLYGMPVAVHPKSGTPLRTIVVLFLWKR